MYDSWTCILVQDGPGVLDEDVCAALKLAACDLALRKLDRMRISLDVCEGIIQTEWRTHVVGTRSGVLFRAQITEDTGDYFVNFLLHEDDLKRGADYISEVREKRYSMTTAEGTLPVPELYIFKNLRKEKLH